MEWIGVKNKMPEDGEDVLIYDLRYGCNVGAYISILSIFMNEDCNFKEVTHWMPLPEPPKD